MQFSTVKLNPQPWKKCKLSIDTWNMEGFTNEVYKTLIMKGYSSKPKT